MPKWICFALVALLLAALPPVQIVAADSPARPARTGDAELTGIVSNAATGRALEGARVEVQGIGTVAITDSAGSFRLDHLPSGPVVIVVTYTGLAAVTRSVDLAVGAVNRQNIGLTSDIYKMDQFVVSGEREGNAQAITLQRQSAGVRSIVSADALGAKASNPADLLIRLPGVEGVPTGGDLRSVRIRGLNQNLSTLTVDGNRLADAASAGSSREFQFQSLSSDSIERIEVIKSPTPDMDGDSIGGAINMVSKSAFDSTAGRRILITAGGAMRPFDHRSKHVPQQYSISYAEVFGGKLGVAVNIAHRVTENLISDVTQSYEQLPNGSSAPAYIYSLAITDDRKELIRPRAGLRLDYKFDDRSRFFVSTFLNKIIEHEYYADATWSTGQAIAGRDAAGNFTGTGGIIPGYTEGSTAVRPVDSSIVALRSRTAYKLGQTAHIEIGGVHRFEQRDIDYNAYKSVSKTQYPAQRNLTITARNIGFAISPSDEDYLPTVVQTAGADVRQLSSYTDNDYSVTHQSGWDQYFGSSLNIKQKFSLPVPAYIKIGIRERDQERKLVNTPFSGKWAGPDGVVGVNAATRVNDDNLSQFGSANQNYEDWRLKRYPNLPLPAFQGHQTNLLETAIAQSPQNFIQNLAANLQSNYNGNQHFKEDISAAYVMGNVDLGSLSILGGVRFERTRTRGEGTLQTVTPEEKARRAAYVGALTETEIRRRTAAEFGGRQTRTGEVKSVLPGVHFKWSPTSQLVTRLSYATNIGRPSIGQLIPNTTANYDAQTVSSSNPSLKPQTADNFDVSAEYYFEPAGVVSAGVFLKEIKNFIYTSSGATISPGSDNGFNGDYAGFAYTTQLNGGAAKIKGLELNYSQQFTFLPGFFRSFGAFANYTRLEAEGNYANGTATTLAPAPPGQIAGFNPTNANVGVSYITTGLSLRVQVNYRGRYLNTYNVNDSRKSYLRSATTVDFKGAYKLTRRLEAYLDVNNIFATPDTQSEWFGGRPQRMFVLSPLFQFGVNFRL